MRYYDVRKIEKIIESLPQGHPPVYVGMKEDWGWTADIIYTEEEGFTDRIGFKGVNRCMIAGIDGSIWATPVLRCGDIDEEVYFQIGDQEEMPWIME